VDESISALKGGDLPLIIIDADDRMTHLSETDCSYQPNVSRSDDSNRNGFAHIYVGSSETS
jgi:hypothetical protein